MRHFGKSNREGGNKFLAAVKTLTQRGMVSRRALREIFFTQGGIVSRGGRGEAARNSRKEAKISKAQRNLPAASLRALRETFFHAKRYGFSRRARRGGGG